MPLAKSTGERRTETRDGLIPIAHTFLGWHTAGAWEGYVLWYSCSNTGGLYTLILVGYAYMYVIVLRWWDISDWYNARSTGFHTGFFAGWGKLFGTAHVNRWCAKHALPRGSWGMRPHKFFEK